MKTYLQTFTATVPVKINIAGRHFRLIECTDAVKVEFFDAEGQSKDETMDGVNFGAWAEPRDGFWSVQITSTTTQAIRFGISKGRAGIDQSVGSVAVTNLRTLLEAARAQKLWTTIGGLPGLANEQTYSIIWNPPGSGKTARVENVRVWTGAASKGVTVTRVTSIISGAVKRTDGIPSPKYLGGAACPFEQWDGTNAAFPTTPLLTVAWVLGAELEPLTPGPWILPAGHGLAVQAYDGATPAVLRMLADIAEVD